VGFMWVLRMVPGPAAREPGTRRNGTVAATPTPTDRNNNFTITDR
jgi:hypothetical protein